MRGTMPWQSFANVLPALTTELPGRPAGTDVARDKGVPMAAALSTTLPRESGSGSWGDCGEPALELGRIEKHFARRESDVHENGHNPTTRSRRRAFGDRHPRRIRCVG